MITKISPVNYLNFRRTISFDDILGLSFLDIFKITMHHQHLLETNSLGLLQSELKPMVTNLLKWRHIGTEFSWLENIQLIEKISGSIMACCAYLYKDLMGLLSHIKNHELTIDSAYFDDNSELLIGLGKIPKIDEYIKNANFSNPARNSTKHGIIHNPRYLSDIQYRSIDNAVINAAPW